MPVDYGLQAFCRFYDKMAIRSEVMGRSQHGKLSDTDMVAAPLKHFRLREVMTMLTWKNWGIGITAAIVIVAIGQFIIDCTKAHAIIKKANHNG